MPAKRIHTKSRYGCDQCRKRRVKCDEKSPHCSICISREEICQYSRLPVGQALPHRPSSIREATIAKQTVIWMPPHAPDVARIPSHTTQGSSPTSHEFSHAPKRLRELELMHHWCTFTYMSFVKEFDVKLRDHIIHEAIRHECLMEAVLALTSLHMTTESKISLASAVDTNEALHYQNKAVAGLRNTLDVLSSDNCDALFITSLIIMVCTLVSSLLQGPRNQVAQTTAEAMLKLNDFLKGIKSILDVSRSWLQEGPVGHILGSGEIRTRPIMDFPLVETRRLNETRKHNKAEESILDQAIDTLEEAMLGTRLVFPWITRVEPDFLLCLRDGDDIALLVSMQWGVLLDQYHDLWWAKFSGKILVDEISRTLDTKGEDYAAITKWCRIQVGLRV